MQKSTHVQIIYFFLFVVRVVNGWHRDIDYVTLKHKQLVSLDQY